MKDNIYLELLSLLEREGTIRFANISTIVDQMYLFPEIPSDTALVPGIRERKIDSFLKWFESEGYIILSNISPPPVTNEWIVPIHFEAMITPTGLKYLFDYRISISSLNVNNASLKNYKVQKIGTVVTVVLAFVAAVFSALDYFKPEPKMAELNRNIQVLSKETEGIKLQLGNLQNQKTSPVDPSHKH